MERLVQRILVSAMLTKHSGSGAKMQEVTQVIFRDPSHVLDIYYQVLEERRVEAARAGEAGKGFTVVANEVCQLAEGTESGARDVAIKLEEIQRTVGRLQRLIESVLESFQHILSASDPIAREVTQKK